MDRWGAMGTADSEGGQGVRKRRPEQRLVSLLCCSVMAAALSSCVGADSAPMADQSMLAIPAEESPPPVETPQELDQLVAPIALYPDVLVAQILAASTFPTEIVEADRWIGEHSSLKGNALSQEVDKQSWDPSVKALTQVPTVLAYMDKNLSWTSALGDAYANQSQDVLNAVQAMRQRAEQAGNLKNTPQETVTNDGQQIVIAPANPAVVYVPQYDPWLVYGAPLAAYPGWVPYPNLFVAGPGFYWGSGFGIVGGYGWGWHHWDADWRHHRLDFDHRAYVSRSPTFVAHAGFHAGPDFARRGEFHGGPFRGFAAPRGELGIHSGAFSGFDHGGLARSYSFRGASSLGGSHGAFAGGFHGGGFGGGFHGGGGHR